MNKIQDLIRNLEEQVKYIETHPEYTAVSKERIEKTIAYLKEKI